MSPKARILMTALLAGAATLAPARAAAMSASPGESRSSGAAAELRSRFEALGARLDASPFERPLVLDASHRDQRLTGDVYAILDHAFETVRAGLAPSRHWCDVLTLPFNVQRCHPDGGESLAVLIGRKPTSPIEEATRIAFRYERLADGDGYLRLRLTAAEGPLGTSNYRIVFAAAPLDERRTLVHMHYGYEFGFLSSLAMETYLATSGADKVGFTRVREGHGERLVGGMRGVIERNTMRYFLAIDAYLDSLAAPPAQRQRVRLNRWFDATERYPRQLREMDRAEYLEIKRRHLAG